MTETTQEIINKTLKFATEAHEGQTRSDGSPYINHPLRVTLNLTYAGGFDNDINDVYAAAMLHDTVEDCGVTYETIEGLFNSTVASLVEELTNDKEECNRVGKIEYLSEKMLDMTSDALTIKLSDRYDNVCDIETAKSEKWRKKYKFETLGIMSKLLLDRNLNQTQKKFVRAIIDQVTKK